MMKDLFNSIQWSMAEPPVAAQTNADTAIVSTILDTQNSGSAVYCGLFGTNTDANATFTVLVEDGDDSSLSDAAAVADQHLCGVEAMGLDYSKDNKAFKIGYIGPKRYVRVTITPSGNNSGDVFMAAGWLQANWRKGPKSTQIV